MRKEYWISKKEAEKMAKKLNKTVYADTKYVWGSGQKRIWRIK